MASLEDLHSILLSEVEAYRQLVTLTQHEREAMQQGDLVELTTAIHDKQNWVTCSTQWSSQRQQLVQELAEQFNLSRQASLSDLVAFCHEALADDLAALREEFTGLVEQLVTLNQGNELLIQAELDRIDLTLNHVAMLASPAEGCYTMSGNTRGQAGLTASSTLDCQV